MGLHLKLRYILGIVAILAFIAGRADAAGVTALQGLNGNTLVAGKATAFRMFADSHTFADARNIDATIVRPDGSTLDRHWTAASFISITNSSQGPSLVVRVAGADLPWVGAYGFEARAFNDTGALLAKFSLPAFELLPTRDLIVGIDRVWATDANPGPPNEIQAARDAMERLAAIWPIRDGISQPDADRTAGLRYVINNNPIGKANQDSQTCPFLASLYDKPPGTDVLNLGVTFRFQDRDEKVGGRAPFFCKDNIPPVGWAQIVMSGAIAPGFGQETGHVFELEPTDDPHYDHNPNTQAMHSKDNTISTLDSDLGFDIKANRAFPSPTFDVMHQAVCGCPNDEVAYNTWDWEFLRKHFMTFSSTGPTLPAHFMTDVSPAVAGVGPDIYFIAMRIDGRLFFSRATLGGGGDGYREMDGNGQSASAPSAAAIGTHLFVAIEGQDQHLYLNQADDRHSFGQWIPLDFGSDVAPGLSAVGNSIFVFAKGLDQKIYLKQAVLGHAFSGWFEVQGGGRTDASPAAAAVGTHVFVAIKGLDGNIYLNQADFGHAFGQWFPMNFNTDAPPALVAVNQTIFVFAKGLDRRIYVNQAVFGGGFSGWFEVQGGGRTEVTPSAGAVSTHLFVAIKGLDRSVYVNQADFGHAFGGWFP